MIIYRSRTHQTTETFECAGDANMRVDLDQDTASSVNINLEKTSFVQRRIEESKETLKIDVSQLNDRSQAAERITQ